MWLCNDDANIFVAICLVAGTLIGCIVGYLLAIYI